VSPTAGTAVGFLALAHVEVDVPLSEHEQRLLEQIERALVDDDPKFASSVRSGDNRGKARRRLQLGVLLLVVGMAALVGGAVIPSVPLGALGFLVAFGGVALAVLNYRSAAAGAEAGTGGPAGGAAPGRGGRGGRGGKVRRQPLKNRLEERFRRRYDQ
jgi:hypothetical protein